MQILECNECGLVMLNDTNHLPKNFYENSGMHGSEPVPLSEWLAETEWDDLRRFEMLKPLIPNKRLLDFGCGAAGFLNKARSLAGSVTGVELEKRVQEYWHGKINIFSTLESARGKHDIITAFHVIEHLIDPRTTLKRLAGLLESKGQIIIEVPSAEDVLLTLYDCDAFQRFTYWSQHLFLFNASTLKTLARQAGLRIVAIKYYQRYPLSNHLYWLSKGKPGGHKQWLFLDSPDLSRAYANALEAIGRADTLIAWLEPLNGSTCWNSSIELG